MTAPRFGHAIKEITMNAKSRILFILCLIYILSFFLRLCPAVLSIDISLDLGVPTSEIVLFSSTTMLVYGLVQMPSGLLSDALGGKNTILLLMLLAGLSTIVFSLGENITLMTVSRGITGVGIAVSVPAMAILARSFPPEIYGRSVSMLICCGGLGGILASPPLIAFSEAFGWRTAMTTFGILTLVLAVMVLFFIPGEPARQSREKTSIKSVACSIWQVMTSRYFWPPTLWLMLTAGIYFTLASLWWGPYLIEGCGLSMEEVGVILTISSLMMLITQPICGYLSDAVLCSRKKPLLFLSGFGIAASMMMVLFTGEMTFPILIGQTICLMLGISTGSPIVFAMMKELFPLNMAGTAIGCMNMFYPVWAALMQAVFGLIYEGFQWESPSAAFSGASWLIVANCTAAFIVCFFMKETFSSRPAE